MVYEKTFIGKVFQWSCFSVDPELKLLSVASKDGAIFICSQNNVLIYQWKVDSINMLQFIYGEGLLIGIGDGHGLHLWKMKHKNKPIEYSHHQLYSSIIRSEISYIHYCKNVKIAIDSTNEHPILMGDNNGYLQLILINDNSIVSSNHFDINSGTESPNRINQIIELSYQKETMSFLVLTNKRLLEVKCHIKWEVNDNCEIISICLNVFRVIPLDTGNHDILHVELTGDNQIMICISDGKYICKEYLGDGDLEINESDIIFPYGPFPCKNIDKSLLSYFKGINEICSIFSGGMPAVTYRNLNTVSICIKDEPEICFTFDDIVVDFTIISNFSYDIPEIIVLTLTELISISYRSGNWISEVHGLLSPFSKNEISAISNIIEVESGNRYSFPNINDQMNENSTIQMFVTSSNDNTISIWSLSEDKYFLYENINLNIFYKSISTEGTEKIYSWPRFKKCGNWKSLIKEITIIECMKFIKYSHESTFLLISTNRKSIFLFQILLESEQFNDEKLFKSWNHFLHIVLNDTGTNMNEINRFVIMECSHTNLITLITFNENLDVFAIDFDVTSNIISFAGAVGIGCVNIKNGKHLFLSSAVLEQVESLKSGNYLSDVIRKTFKKRNSAGVSILRNEFTEVLNTTSSKPIKVRPKSMKLWRNNNDSFDLILGFCSGSIIIIYFTLDENGDFNLENLVRKLDTNSTLPIIEINIIEMKSDSLTYGDYLSLSKNSTFDDTVSMDKTVDSSFDSSISMEIKSVSPGVSSNNSNNATLVRKLKMNFLQHDANKPVSKVLLLRCNVDSVKILDYFKLKTKYKFKMHDYYGQLSKSTTNRKKSVSEIILPKIDNCRVIRNDRSQGWYMCRLILSDKSMLELQLPNLCPLRTINFDIQCLHLKLISMNLNIIIIAVNKNCQAELMILSSYRHKAYYFIPKDKKLSIENLSESMENDENHKTDDCSLDFMKEARSSLRSLLL